MEDMKMKKIISLTDDSLLTQIEFFRNTFFLDEKELIL